MKNGNLQMGTSRAHILQVAAPISFAILVPQLNFIINNIFLGHFSEQSLAAASITGVYYLVFAMIGFGFNNGVQALISRRAGENKQDEIGKIFSQAVLLVSSFASIGILFTYFLAPTLLKLFLHDQEIVKDSISFLQIRIWGLPFLYVYQMRNALLVGINQSRYLIVGTLSETIANILFDYLLIFGNWGLPALGFNGAAVASIIAEFVGVFATFLIIRNKGITTQFKLFKDMKWDAASIRQIINISLPLIFQFAISIISWEFFYILIEHHGRTAMAISNVMRNIFGLLGCITWAFGATCAAMVSNIIGQQKQSEVLPLIRRIIKMSLTTSIIISIVINIFPTALLSIYGQGPEFIEAAIPVTRVVTVAMLFMSFSVVWLNAVAGTGNSRVALIIEIITIVLYCTYVYLVLEKYKLSISIGWMSEWLYWLSLFTFSFIYMKSNKWQLKKI